MTTATGTPVPQNPARSSLTRRPLWLSAVTKFRRPTDAGLGDTLVHLIGDARSERFKKWFARKFGKSCGCTDRQRWLNDRFSYAEFSPQTDSDRAR